MSQTCVRCIYTYMLGVTNIDFIHVPFHAQATGRDKVLIEESKVKAAYSISDQAVSLSRSESFQHAVANDIVSASLPAASSESR